MTTYIIDGDTNKMLEVRTIKNYANDVETSDMLEKQYNKKIVFHASNGVYGKNCCIFVLSKESVA